MPKDDRPASPLSDQQRKIFDALTSGEYSNLCMLSGTFQGHPVAYICAATDKNGEILFWPLAIIIDNAFEDRFKSVMKNPNGTPLVPFEEKA